MSIELWQDENEFLAVTLYEDASALVQDKLSGMEWRMGSVALQEDNPVDVGHVWLRRERSICEEYPGHFRGQVEGTGLRFTLLGREGREVGQFVCRVRLEGPKLVIRIVEIDESLPSLVFPTPFVSESLVVPSNVGRWIRKPLETRNAWLYPVHLNMRWFGGLRGEHGWIAIVEEGYTDGGVMATKLAISPLWLKSLGKWSGERTISYQFVNGGYVALAKTFRAYAIEHGLHVSLEEKKQENPALENLQGAPLLSFMQAWTLHSERYPDHFMDIPEHVKKGDKTLEVRVSHAQLSEIFEKARKRGMDHGLVVVRGWSKGGYDEFHPAVWPPEPALGSVEELKNILHIGENFTVALHDNYQDIYQQSPDWPHGVNRTATGDPLLGGYWDGGQAYIVNSRNALLYAQRNWRDIATLQPRAMFLDTTTAVQFFQSYEEGNTLTRAQDEANKIAMLRFYKEQGVVQGNEEGADFGMAYVDWIENRHTRVAGESIPLWPLVFHDAAFCARYGHEAGTEEGQNAAPHWLTDMLWGYMLLWDFRNRAREEKKLEKMEALRFVDEWHGRIGADEMLSHRYLTEDGQVEETTFAGGISIIVNFAKEERIIEGEVVPGYGYRISSREQ